MKLALVLTNDWELFGDGSGNFDEIMENPLNEYLSILEHYDAKITLFAEVLQQFEHKKYSEQFKHLGIIYNKWEDLIRKTIEKGHDVQLHLHPQWIGSKFDGNDWQLDLNKWALSSLNYEEINEIIGQGKDYLENLIKKIRPDYKCQAFRAGNYCIEPAVISISALKNNGFTCDSSVTKGLYSPGLYDFRDAYSNVFSWKTSDKNVKYASDKNNGLLEIPIYSDFSDDSQALKKLTPALYFWARYGVKVPSEEIQWLEEKEHIRNKRYPVERRHYKKGQKKNLSFYINAILSKSATQLDYDKLPASVFVRILSSILKNPKVKAKEHEYLPVVASGHTKDVHSGYNLKQIIKKIRNKYDEKIVFWTMTEAIDYYKSIE